MKTSTTLQPTPPPQTSSAEVSPAKTSLAREKARALLDVARDCGFSFTGSSKSCNLNGLWLKTSHLVQEDGSIRSATGWLSSAMRRFRSKSAHRLLALHTHDGVCLSSQNWPTLTAKANLVSPSMQKWRGHRNLISYLKENGLLPTLVSSTRGGYQQGGGAAGRVGKKRPHLNTIAGGPLHPRWMQWYQGFPDGWTTKES